MAAVRPRQPRDRRVLPALSEPHHPRERGTPSLLKVEGVSLQFPRRREDENSLKCQICLKLLSTRGSQDIHMLNSWELCVKRFTREEVRFWKITWKPTTRKKKCPSRKRTTDLHRSWWVGQILNAIFLSFQKIREIIMYIVLQICSTKDLEQDGPMG